MQGAAVLPDHGSSFTDSSFNILIQKCDLNLPNRAVFLCKWNACTAWPASSDVWILLIIRDIECWFGCWLTDFSGYETRRFKAAFKKLSNNPYSERNQSKFSYWSPLFVKIFYNINLPSIPRSFINLPINILKELIFYSILATYPTHLNLLDLIILLYQVYTIIFHILKLTPLPILIPKGSENSPWDLFIQCF